MKAGNALLVKLSRLNSYIIKDADHNYQPLVNGAEVFFETASSAINSFMDSTAEEGKYYSYHVRFLGVNGDTSSASLPVGVFVPLNLQPPPNNLIAMMQNGSVLLQWDMPLGDTWDEVRIYRAVAGSDAVQVAKLKANDNSFRDSEVKKGENYFYWIATVKKGTESKTKQPVGIRVE